MKILISRRRSWMIKYIFLIPFVTFMLFSSKVRKDSRDVENLVHNMPENLKELKIKISDLETLKSEIELKKQIVKVQNPKVEEIDIELLKKIVHDANKFPKINNEHFISDLLKNVQKTEKSKFLVMLIQIHSRLNYLQSLIDSLKSVKGIENVLVIFSHDIYDQKMNNLINSIKFCATLQIFYPYSIQLYKNEFPGEDPNDCLKKISKKDAILKKCNNAYHYDTYGNYREDKVVQIKHHWFWKISFVFEKLIQTKDLENLKVLLLEEDYYLMPDSLYVIEKLSEKIQSDVDVVSLAYLNKLVQNLEFKNLNLYNKGMWLTSHHNTGLILARTQWKMIKNCLNAFCVYDDYNWDWTLQHLSQTCFPLPWVSIYPQSSRVIHIGQCGTHYKSKNCDPKNTILSLEKSFNDKKKDFFPENFKLDKINTAIIKIRNSNGGWSDPRDHQLCKSFLSNSSDLRNISIIL